MIFFKKIFILIFLIFSSYSGVIAQKKPFLKMSKISSAFRAGLLNGEADKPGSELQLVSGLAYKTWFTGIGAGIDYYSNLKSIPLFIDIIKDIKGKKNTPFINADLGYNLPLEPKDKKDQPWIKYNFEAGLYYELGAGYKFTLTNSLALALSAGYSYKNLKEKDTIPAGAGPADEPLPPQINIYDYKFRRLSVKVGFWF